jgi:hypothetical protein
VKFQVSYFWKKVVLRGFAEWKKKQYLSHQSIWPVSMRRYTIHLFIFQFAGNNRLLNIYKNLNAHMQFVRYCLMNNVGGKLPTTDREQNDITGASRA